MIPSWSTTAHQQYWKATANKCDRDVWRCGSAKHCITTRKMLEMFIVPARHVAYSLGHVIHLHPAGWRLRHCRDTCVPSAEHLSAACPTAPAAYRLSLALCFTSCLSLPFRILRGSDPYDYLDEAASTASSNWILLDLIRNRHVPIVIAK